MTVVHEPQQVVECESSGYITPPDNEVHHMSDLRHHPHIWPVTNEDTKRFTLPHDDPDHHSQSIPTGPSDISNFLHSQSRGTSHQVAMDHHRHHHVKKAITTKPIRPTFHRQGASTRVTGEQQQHHGMNYQYHYIPASIVSGGSGRAPSGLRESPCRLPLAPVHVNVSSSPFMSVEFDPGAAHVTPPGGFPPTCLPSKLMPYLERSRRAVPLPPARLSGLPPNLASASSPVVPSRKSIPVSMTRGGPPATLALVKATCSSSASPNPPNPPNAAYGYCYPPTHQSSGTTSPSCMSIESNSTINSGTGTGIGATREGARERRERQGSIGSVGSVGDGNLDLLSTIQKLRLRREQQISGSPLPGSGSGSSSSANASAGTSASSTTTASIMSPVRETRGFSI